MLDNNDAVRITVQAQFDYKVHINSQGAVGLDEVKLNPKSRPVALVTAQPDREVEPEILKRAAEKLAFALDEIFAEK